MQQSNISNSNKFVWVFFLKWSILPGVCPWTLDKVKCCLQRGMDGFSPCLWADHFWQCEIQELQVSGIRDWPFISFCLKTSSKHPLLSFFYFFFLFLLRESKHKQCDLAFTSRSSTQHPVVKSFVLALRLKHCLSKHSLANCAPGKEQPLEQCGQFNHAGERREPVWRLFCNGMQFLHPNRENEKWD